MSLRPTRQILLAAVVLTGLALAGPFGSTAGATRAGSSKIAARIGHLEVIDPFLPDPASPSVAAIYLTVKNTGFRPDELVAVSSPVSSDSMLMRENGSNSSMAMLSELRIPAHGEASLKPGHEHLMLEQPTVKFKVGETVLVTLRFERSGSVTLKVPVVPLSRIIGN
jgi:periplasmic copper chaperone A